MSENGKGQTLEARIKECLSLAALSATPEERRGYLAEANGLDDVLNHRPSNVARYEDERERAAYERGQSDGETLQRFLQGRPL